jgi:hypothetical protein
MAVSAVMSCRPSREYEATRNVKLARALFRERDLHRTLRDPREQYRVDWTCQHMIFVPKPPPLRRDGLISSCLLKHGRGHLVKIRA